MYLLPSLFTAGNIGAGYYAMTQSIQGTATDHTGLDHAALAIGVAALLDGVDGFIARLTGTASDFGRELDSLADVITFGVAPSLLAYLWGFRLLPETAYPALRDNVMHGGLLVCFLFLICGASRLARFNIAVNPQPRNPGKPGSKFFVGMPIPAGAGVIAAVVHCFDGSPIYSAWTSVVWLLLIAGTSFLMVSNWRFWSAKEITSGNRQPFQLFALIGLMLALIAWKSEWMLMAIAMGYLVSGVCARLAYAWGRRHAHGAGSRPG
ncbi:MAG TPA: CDP-diacylglycerol--serine O-phosphatidyltransferase [Acidobacteriaceae bacterium]|nr:CDP-diacylglycerol--serine O-phosphatidyltransferase [Acidobacteriaceae bacterium]